MPFQLLQNQKQNRFIHCISSVTYYIRSEAKSIRMKSNSCVTNYYSNCVHQMLRTWNRLIWIFGNAMYLIKSFRFTLIFTSDAQVASAFQSFPNWSNTDNARSPTQINTNWFWIIIVTPYYIICFRTLLSIVNKNIRLKFTFESDLSIAFYQ